MTTVTSPWAGLGQPLFEMCWVYMAIAQIAQDPPPLSNGQTWKKVFQTILASPYIPGHTLVKKVLQTILASLKHLPNIEEEGVYLEKGLGTFTHLVKVRVLALLSIRFA